MIGNQHEDDSWERFAEYIADMFMKIRETEERKKHKRNFASEFNPRFDLDFIDTPVSKHSYDNGLE